MKNNFDKETNLYRFIKVNGLDDITKFNISDISVYTYLEQEQVDKLKHIKENLYELNGNYFIPSDLD
ncbi:hypothetical protein [Maribacter sp. 4G9]|uniref:hypothetical protein n=1 Tax=Maribacter sp. 4G9 TaxID=1889777 RepID=UPI000C14937D|nr:hypothetical protein [Maribacter sp. 4G9]PIB26244.1 hypothetical protein BFP75_08370 [Maribacter sp. 4G9]